jgi:hypothetical protein
LTTPRSSVIVHNMDTMIRRVPEDEWADIRKMAGEQQTSANLVMLEMLHKGVEAYRKDEKKRLTKRLDELNQGKLV